MHALVPGGGPALEGQGWVTSRHPTQRNRRQPYLVDNVLLGQRFRKKFTNGFRRLVRAGKLRLEGDWAWLREPRELEAWLIEVTQLDWNVFIEGPPHGKSQPVQVLKYLARYLTGGPISDRRIIRDENGRVTFWARSKNKAAGNRAGEFELLGKEFVRRRPTFGRCPDAHSSPGLYPLALLRRIPRQQTQGLSASLPGAALDCQSPTASVSRTHRTESAEMPALRDRDVLHSEGATSQLEGGLRATHLRRSVDLFASAPLPLPRASRLSVRTGRIAMIPTSVPTLTACTSSGISRPISDVARGPRRGSHHALTILVILAATSLVQERLGGLPCHRAPVADKLRDVGRVTRSESA